MEMPERNIGETEVEYYQRAEREYYAWQAREDKKNALKQLFSKSNLDEMFYETGFSFWDAVFYWIKTLLCLLLSRYGSGDFEMAAWDVQPYETIEVSGTKWRACWVGEGYFKNWQVELCEDTSV